MDEREEERRQLEESLQAFEEQLQESERQVAVLEQRIADRICDTLVLTEHEPVVTVGRSSSLGELPELDDEFAMLASEFDTLEELRADVEEQLLRGGRLSQALAARDKALEYLLDAVDVPLPEAWLRVLWMAPSGSGWFDEIRNFLWPS